MITVSTTAMQGTQLFDFIHLLQKQEDKSTQIELFFDTLPFLQEKYYRTYCQEFITEHRLGMHCPIQGCDLLAEKGSLLLSYTLDRHKECLELAAGLEIPYWVLHTNGTEPFALSELSAKNALLAERILLLTEMAEQYSCQTWVENVGFAHADNLAVDYDSYEALILSHQEFFSLIDIGHAYINSWNIPLLIETLSARLRGVHLHDNFGRDDIHAAMGEGSIYWPPIWDALLAIPQDINLILEYQTGTSFDKIIKTKQSIERLYATFQK